MVSLKYLSFRIRKKSKGTKDYCVGAAEGLPFRRRDHVNIRSIRPAYGMKPKYYKEVLGKTANKELKAGTPLREEDLQ